MQLATKKALQPNEVLDMQQVISHRAACHAICNPNFGATIRKRYYHFFRSFRSNH